MNVKFKIDDETMRERKRRRVLSAENRPQSINKFICIIYINRVTFIVIKTIYLLIYFLIYIDPPPKVPQKVCYYCLELYFLKQILLIIVSEIINIFKL